MSLLSLNLTTNLPSSLNFIIFPNFPRTPHFNYYSLICLFYVVLLDFFFFNTATLSLFAGKAKRASIKQLLDVTISASVLYKDTKYPKQLLPSHL